MEKNDFCIVSVEFLAELLVNKVVEYEDRTIKSCVTSEVRAEQRKVYWIVSYNVHNVFTSLVSGLHNKEEDCAAQNKLVIPDFFRKSLIAHLVERPIREKKLSHNGHSGKLSGTSSFR